MREELMELFGSVAYDDESREVWFGDVAEMDAADLADEFLQAARVLEGFVIAAETLGFGTYLALSDCREKAWEAQRRARARA